MPLEDLEKEVTAALILLSEPGVVRVGERQRCGTCSLEWGGCTDRNKSCTFRIPAVSQAGAMVQPTRQPVTLNVFDKLLIVTVCSAMPSMAAIGTCSASS